LDDERIYDAEKVWPWDQDAIEVRIDARPDPLRSLSRENGTSEMTRYVIVWLAPGRTPEEVLTLHTKRLGELGVIATGLFTERG